MLSKTELRYLNHGKIYKLVCNITGDTYYGSTTQSLKERLSKHKSKYKRYLNGKINYITSFKIIENGNYKICLVEDYKCLNRKQLESIEGIYIKYNKCINKNIAGRTPNEYYKKIQKYNKLKQDVKSITKKRFDNALKYMNLNDVDILDNSLNERIMIEFFAYDYLYRDDINYKNMTIDNIKLETINGNKYCNPYTYNYPFKDCECGSKYIFYDIHSKTNKHKKYLLRKEYLVPNFKSCSLLL